MMSDAAGPALRFTRFSREHLDGVMAIEAEAYPEPWSVGMFQQEMTSGRSYFYVMHSGDALVGYGGFWLVLDEVHLTRLTVRKESRGKGYGRRLIEFLLELAVQLGARTATLEVRVTNAIARSLYASLGFKPVGLRRNYYPKSREDAVVLLKEFC